MSILTLLADFPNYSARRIRRLAKQIAIVQQAAKAVDEPNILKGIEADLIEYNLLQAKTEERLNDDLGKVGEVPVQALPVIRENERWPGDTRVKREWWGMDMALPDTLEEAHEWINDMLDQWKQLAGNMGFQEFQDPEVLIERAKKAAPPHPDMVSERINVCPTVAARRAVDECFNWMLQHTDAKMKPGQMDNLKAKCNGIISGQSFYTDRTFIQAKLSPQDGLPLHDPQSPAA